MHIRKRFIYISGALLVILVLFLLIPPPAFKESLSTVVYDRQNMLLSARVADDEQWRFPLSDSVPYRFTACIKGFEDQYFDYHPGFNPISLFRALFQNISEGRVVSGGSTISMQVVRLSRKGKSRSVLEKFIEIILALRLELTHSKSEILNLYASYAPFGGNVVGLEAASWRYFGRPSYTLSWGEAAALAVLPNAPSIIYPGKNESAYEKKRNRLLNKLKRAGIIDSVMLSLSKLEDLPSDPHALPDLAPHFLQTMSANGFKEKIVRSSIDYDMQVRFTALLDRYHEIYRQNEIHNGAILVVENRTRKVRAYIGNTKTKGSNRGSHVDILTAQRSTGSLLKPFLYALAMDDGRITKNTLLADIPTRIAGFSPKNFDKKYAGAVPAYEALTHSLNVPAVRLLKEYGLEKFYNRLSQLQFRSINKGPNHYGLSIILGGAESNAVELVGAFSGMANQLRHHYEIKGKYYSNEFGKLNFLEAQEVELGEVVSGTPMSNGAIWNTLEMLTELQRPRPEGDWKQFESSKKIAWKTGTSYGFRDAWAVGVTLEYTVGVWIGNASGEGRPGLIGLEAAAPVMFDVFNKLPDADWFIAPYDDLEKIIICEKSGDLAGSDCETTLEIDHPYHGRHGLHACKYHRIVHLDINKNHQVNSSCYPVDKMINEPWFVLPPAVEWYYLKHEPDYKRLPPFSVACIGSDEPVLQIIYPAENTVVRIPRELDGSIGRVVMEAAHHFVDCPVFWHLDDNYIESTIGEHKIELLPDPGVHRLSLLDGLGNSLEVRFTVIE